MGDQFDVLILFTLFVRQIVNLKNVAKYVLFIYSALIKNFVKMLTKLVLNTFALALGPNNNIHKDVVKNLLGFFLGLSAFNLFLAILYLY